MKLSYSKLAEHLERRVDPVYFLVGDQDLLRELAGKKLKLAAVGETPTAFNAERLDGEVSSPDQILMTANTMPLLGGRRFVLVKRASRLVDGSEAFQRYVSDPSPHAVLVLDLEKKPDGRRKAWKELETKAVVVGCDAPGPQEVEDWVLEEGQARGLSLSREDVRYLTTELGTDLRRLLNELEKLSLYAGGDRLDPETIAEVLGRGKAQSIFKFIDAVAGGDAGSALRQLARLLQEGEAPLRILALLDRLVGQLRVAKEAASSASGRGGSSLASILGVPPPVARSLAQRARGMNEAHLRRAVAAVADTDRILKSSRLPDRVVLESLVIALTKAATGRGSQRAVAARRLASRDL